MIDLTQFDIPQYAKAEPTDLLDNPPVIHKFNGLTGAFSVGTRSVGTILQISPLAHRFTFDGSLQILFIDKASSLLSLINLRNDSATNIYACLATYSRYGLAIPAFLLTLGSRLVTIKLIDGYSDTIQEKSYFACDVTHWTLQDQQATQFNQSISSRVDWQNYLHCEDYDFE